MEKGEINFFSETDFTLSNEKSYQAWISRIIESEQKFQGDINYIFCDDEYLLEINQQYLDHDTYTDIISFDYSIGNVLQGDIYISIERVRENAQEFSVDFETELKRVIAHGVLHFSGYKDKDERDRQEMRRKEEEKIELFHVEQS